MGCTTLMGDADTSEMDRPVEGRTEPTGWRFG